MVNKQIAELKSRYQEEKDKKRIRVSHRLYLEVLAMFAKLKENIGEEVLIEYVWFNKVYKEVSKLKSVDSFVQLITDSGGFPFIGNRFAIRRVENALTCQLLYTNNNIDSSYCGSFLEDITQVMALSWGLTIVQKHWDENVKEYRKMLAEVEMATAKKENRSSKIVRFNDSRERKANQNLD